LQNVIELSSNYMMERQFNGWYPQLFYKGVEDSDKWDQIVADVQTAPIDPGFGYPGEILHEGVGFVNLMVIAIESQDDRVVYLGPTLSHYEFTTNTNGRMDDDTWRTQLEEGRTPPREASNLDFLAPNEEIIPLGLNWSAM
jgi:hypothetical protein